jgi:hypothetical protein
MLVSRAAWHAVVAPWAEVQQSNFLCPVEAATSKQTLTKQSIATNLETLFGSQPIFKATSNPVQQSAGYNYTT